MPNLAFQIEVLKKTIAELASPPDPTVSVNPLAQSVQNDDALMQYAVLGALGPDIFRYTPVSSATATFLSDLVTSAPASGVNTSALTALTWPTPPYPDLYFNPLGAAYSLLFSTVVVTAWPIINQITDILNQADAIIGNEAGAAGMIGKIQEAQTDSQSLSGLSATITNVTAVGSWIVTQGPWMEMPPLPPALNNPQPWDNIMNRRHEFLRWHETGKFAQNLWSNAVTPNQQAYALGWLCNVASSVTAEPFVNNIAGGPYRTHWWRNRFAGNFVDSWTYGFFEQSPLPVMTGDTPVPAYFDTVSGAGWPSICSANLQNQFNVAGLEGPSTPGGIPPAVAAMASGDLSQVGNLSALSEISALLSQTINETYTGLQPIAGIDANGQPIPAFDDNTFANAYVGAFAVYWFMTSGSANLGNNPAVSIPPPGPVPSWVTAGKSPPSPQKAVNVAGVVCAIAAAIAAIFEIWVGNYGGGLAALIALFSAPIINWSQVATDLYWLRYELVNAQAALRDALVWTGMAYPPPVLLGIQTPAGTLPVTDFTGIISSTPPTNNVPATGGVWLCKTNSLSNPSPGAKVYPRGVTPAPTTSTIPPDMLFFSYPNAPVEEPSADILIPPNLYPNSVVQGLGGLNGGMNGAPAQNATFPTGDRLFGDAVTNAVQLIQSGASGLPDYNLDADRGYGWQTWDLTVGSQPLTGIVSFTKEP